MQEHSTHKSLPFIGVSRLSLEQQIPANAPCLLPRATLRPLHLIAVLLPELPARSIDVHSAGPPHVAADPPRLPLEHLGECEQALAGRRGVRGRVRGVADDAATSAGVIT